MSGIATAIAVTGVASAGASYANSRANKKALKGLESPEYYDDPRVEQMQEKLQPFGERLLDGDIPEYYKPIGEYGGQEFENWFNLTKRDISTQAQEMLAKQGRSRGGALPAVTAKATGDASIKARFADFERAMAGRKDLMRTGVDVLEGVRASASGQEANRNTFNLKDYENEFLKTSALNSARDQEYAAIGKMIGSVGGGVTGFMDNRAATTMPKTTSDGYYWDQRSLDNYFARV